jgi:type VI secretion system protein ImpL
MNDPRLILRSLEPTSTKEESAPSSRLAIWGIPVAALVVALLAIGIVSLRGDMVGVTAGESRLKAIIVILSTFAVVVVVHLVLFATGAYGFAARLFRSETGGPGAFTIKAGSFTFVGPDNVPAQLPVLPKSDLKLNDQPPHTN